MKDYNEYARSQDSIVEHCQSLVEEGDKYYEVHKEDIRVARNHFQLTSDHLSLRGAIPGRSSHYFPVLHPSIYARAAYVLDAFISSDPPASLSSRIAGIAWLDESVQRLEDLVTMWFKEGHLWKAWFEAWLSAELFPYAPIFMHWDDKWGDVPFVTPDGKIDYKSAIIYSGGMIESIPIENYRGDMFARTQDDMRFHIRLKDVSPGYVRHMAKLGYYRYFDENRIDDMKLSRWAKERSKNRIVDDYPQPDSYNIELIQVMHKIYQDDYGREIWRKAIFAGSMLLEEEVWPYFDMGAPFKLITSRVLPGEITSIPGMKLGAASQNLINELWNQRIEANEQSIWAPTLFEGDITSNPVWEPQALWQVEKPESFRPLIKPNLSGELVGDIRFLEERQQQLMQTYDTMQPVTGKSKQTLGEYEGKQQSHNKILNVTLLGYVDAVIDSVQMMIAMARDRMPDNIEMKLFGSNNILNQLSLTDLASDVVVDIPKVRALSVEHIEIAKWMGLYDRMMNNPLIASDPQKIYELTRRYLDSQDVKAIDKIIGEQPQVNAIPGGY